MSDLRPALGAGLLYGAPFALWLAGTLKSGPNGADLSAALPVLAILQGLAVLLFAPTWAQLPAIAERLAAAALTLAIPWPVLTLALAAGSTTLATILAVELVVALWALVAIVLQGALRRLPDPWRGLGWGVVQGLGALLLLWLARALGGASWAGLGPSTTP